MQLIIDDESVIEIFFPRIVVYTAIRIDLPVAHIVYEILDAAK